MSKVNWWVKAVRKPKYVLQPHRTSSRIWSWLTKSDYTGLQTVRLPWRFSPTPTFSTCLLTHLLFSLRRNPSEYRQGLKNADGSV